MSKQEPAPSVARTEHGDAEKAQPPRLRIELAGAGWVLLLAALLGIYLLLKLTWPLISGQQHAIPLGRTVSELNFDVSNALVPADQIIAAAPPGSIPPLLMPSTVKGSEAASLTKEYRRKYHHKFVVAGDRVVGVSIRGESRAYQLKLLQWHEVANDVLGGVPIAVTYSPLTDSVVVFDRRLDAAEPDFSASGLLYNSNSLLTDIVDENNQSQGSLWSQLDGKAQAGPRAGQQLTILPCELTHWGDWLKRHPDSTLLSHDTGHSRKYTTNAYGPYFDRMKLRFPVQPAPSGSIHDQFVRMIAVQQVDGRWKVWDYSTLREQSEQDGLRFVYEPYAPGMEPDSVRIDGGAAQPVVYGLRFALEAFGYL